MDYISTRTQMEGIPLSVVSKMQGPLNKHRTGHGQGQLDTSPYMPWNNSQPEKNSTAELRIESGASLSVGNDVTTESSARTRILILGK